MLIIWVADVLGADFIEIDADDVNEDFAGATCTVFWTVY